MIAEDIAPNRITVAKNVLNNFIQNREDATFSVILFAGKPFTVIKNSMDISGITHFIESITSEYIQQDKAELSGTNIGDALLLAHLEFSETSGEKSIILITDGSANIGIDPLKSLDEIKKSQIPIYTVGI